MKKILVTSNMYLPNIGGIENSLYYLAKAGEKDDVTIIASDIVDTTDVNINREALNCKIIKYKVPKDKSRVLKFLIHLLNAFKAYRKIRKSGCDIVISRFHVNTLLCYLAGLKNINYIVPGVVKYQNAPVNINKYSFSIVNKLNYRVNCILQYLAFKASHKIWVFSESMKAQVQSVLPSSEPTLTSPGVDWLKFNYVEKKEFNSINLLTVSRINGAKNLEMAIESLQYLPANYSLTIVGDGPLLGELQSLSERLALTDRVFFEGSKSDVVPYYHRSHLFLLPSTYEPFGQTLLEASSCGVPTVAFHSSIVDTATVKILDKYGVYAHELNAKSYSEAILRAYKIYYQQNEMKDIDLSNYIIKNYSWNNLYNDLVNNSK